jgi:hypothetical protein
VGSDPFEHVQQLTIYSGYRLLSVLFHPWRLNDQPANHAPRPDGSRSYVLADVVFARPVSMRPLLSVIKAPVRSRDT